MRITLVPCFLALTLVPSAQIVRSRLVLDDGIDPFQRCLGSGDRFGSAVASLGDLNGDGLVEFAIGANGDFVNTGAVWIFSLSAGRSIRQFVKVGPDEGGIEGQLDAQDRFGSAITAIGDLDGDGVLDLAVGAPGDDDGFDPPFSGGGAVWVLFMNRNGSVRAFLKFSQTQGNFAGQLDSGDNFGASLTAPGDLDGNGIPDLIVGAPGDDDGPTGANRGALWIVLFDGAGQVLALHKISGNQGGGDAFLVEREGFGTAVAVLGDLNGDGRQELAVGSDRTGLLNERLRILSLAADGSVFAFRDLTGLGGNFGHALANVGDVDGNGVTDLAAGDSLLRLASDGSVLAVTGLGSAASLAGPGDTNANGLPDLVVGSPDFWITGAVTFHDISSVGTLIGSVTVDSNSSGLPIAPSSLTEYGRAIAPLGDLDGDGEPDLAVGDPRDNDGGGPQAGAVWVHFVDGTSGARVNKISRRRGAFPIDTGDLFGSASAPLGDLDGNGSIELAVGAPGDDDGRLDGGALHVLFLRPNGTVNRSVKISLALTLGEPGTAFGRELAQLDDLDGDGLSELAVATSAEVYVLFLDETGNLARWTRINRASFSSGTPLNGGLTWLERTASAGPHLVVGTTTLPARMFRLALDANGLVTSSAGLSADPRVVTSLGDLDGDGIGDLARLNETTVAFEFLTAAFTRKSILFLPLPRFPASDIGPLGDLTGDGVRDLAVRVEVGSRDRLLLLELDGIATAGFERRDALDNFALENGRQIPVPHPGRTFVISSGGANLGAALFDSTPGGPNAASQDPDLLVGSGNVLMLQDSLTGTQSVPSIFDRPNDDRDGGLLALDLPRPVRALSLELIDQDSGLGHGTTVTLIDENGRTRTYDVPPGFTEDVNVTHTGGWRTLRLDTLAPQPGYLATATVSQQPGFLDNRLRRIEVQLSGSGAIDDFLYDPWP